MREPGRRTRLVVAVAMTLWTVLQAATLVVAAHRQGEPSDAFRYAYTGILTMALTALTVVAWRWVARARPGPRPPGPGGSSAPPPAEPAASAETPEHRGLSGRVTPPRRW